MDLVPYIYFERQERGSMLCAQHALNNLLQSPLWSPDNLADIARKLDSIEFHLDNQSQANSSATVDKSPNYDDSVQVIDDALHPLGLRIISWKSEEMKPMHDYPDNQEAFILNHDLHWFTLRRFGQSVDRWYNLNSMAEDSPKWIGPTFLSMSIAQAEAEGYSIFAVVPLPASSEPTAGQPGRLISCEADEQVFVLDQLSYTSSSGGRISSEGSSGSLRRPREEEVKDEPSSSSRTRMKLEDDGDNHDFMTYEDQLQIAIQASLSAPPPIQKAHLNPTESEEQDGGIERTLGSINRFNSDNNHTNDRANHLPESSTKGVSDDQVNQPAGSSDDFESLEDKELAMAISESLLDHQLPSGSQSVVPLPEPFVDEPTPEELRQKRLARFSSQS